MNPRNVIWLPRVRDKLIQFRSTRFTPEETNDFISQIILDTEDLLKNTYVGKTYTEESGKYKGISRIVVKKFQIYFEQFENDTVIVAIILPGENK